MTKQITYNDLELVLQDLDAQLSVAETHGLLTGMLCVAEPKDATAWKSALLEVLDCAKPERQQWAVFTKLRNKISKDFTKDKLSVLFLPDDDAPLTQRLQALADWVSGFLSGMAMMGVSAADLANPVVKELVEDLTQIAKLSPKTDDSEEDEKNFAEIVEYVRIATQNIYIELQAGKEKLLH
jgi:uncharacterized protein